MRKQVELVDIIGYLEPIMKKNTKYYQSDFEIDKEIFWEAVKSTNKEDRVFLWFSRESGTQCIRLADVFLDGSPGNQTVRFFANQDGLKAYLVWLDKEEDGKILGRVKKISWNDYANHILKTAVTTSKNTLFYEQGEIIKEAGTYMPPQNPKLGNLLRYRPLPDDPEAYEQLLMQVM